MTTLIRNALPVPPPPPDKPWTPGQPGGPGQESYNPRAWVPGDPVPAGWEVNRRDDGSIYIRMMPSQSFRSDVLKNPTTPTPTGGNTNTNKTKRNGTIMCVSSFESGKVTKSKAISGSLTKEETISAIKAYCGS